MDFCAVIIAFTNHKGGTGKTTSAINIGRALSMSGKKVLLVDLDPQANLTYSLGLSGETLGLANYLLDEAPYEAVACEAFDMHVLPANLDLYSRENEIRAKSKAQLLLKYKLQEIAHNYDFILLDCPPSISIYTLNALHTAKGLIVPVVFDILSLQGLDQILKTANTIRLTANPDLEILGVLGVIVNQNRRLTEEVLEFIRDNYQLNIFNNHVRNNVRAAEAPSFGKSVLDYAPDSHSARDYKNVSRELLSILEKKTELV